MFRLSVTVPNLCPQPKSSLINRLSMTVCWMFDQLSFIRSLASSDKAVRWLCMYGVLAGYTSKI